MSGLLLAAPVSLANANSCSDAVNQEYRTVIVPPWEQAMDDQGGEDWVVNPSRANPQSPVFCAKRFRVVRASRAVAAYVAKHRCLDTSPAIWLKRATDKERDAREKGCR